jgi:hypothetical protein
MMRRGVVLGTCLLMLLAAVAAAQTAPPLLTAHGTVDKVSKTSITLRPRSAEGKFEKALVLKVTGTSRLTTLVPQVRAGKTVLTQKDTDLKDLEAKRTIAVIYTKVKEGNVLLVGVVQPSGK